MCIWITSKLTVDWKTCAHRLVPKLSLLIWCSILCWSFQSPPNRMLLLKLCALDKDISYQFCEFAGVFIFLSHGRQTLNSFRLLPKCIRLSNTHKCRLNWFYWLCALFIRFGSRQERKKIFCCAIILPPSDFFQVFEKSKNKKKRIKWNQFGISIRFFFGSI